MPVAGSTSVQGKSGAFQQIQFGYGRPFGYHRHGYGFHAPYGHGYGRHFGHGYGYRHEYGY